MSSDSAPSPWPPDVLEALQTAYGRIEPLTAAERLWHRVFTDEDRLQLGGDLTECYPRLGTVGMWVHVRHVSPERAVVEVARALNFLDEATAEWLLREIGDQPPQIERPFWNRANGELLWGDQVIRFIRVLREPSNIQRIVDAFQQAGWPSRVDNPLTLGQQQLHQALRSLNQRLEVIYFRSQEGGLAITWERR